MPRIETRVLVEIALTIALAAVLNALKIWRMPNGGTISLNMLPLFVLAIRRGVGPAVIAGALYGVVDLMFDAYVVNWAQFVLDYPLAYAMIGLAGGAHPAWRRAVAAGDTVRAMATVALPWMIVGTFGRFAAHWYSGIVFFGSFAPAGTPVAVYSAVYNASYIIPSLVASAAAAMVVIPALERAVPSLTAQAHA